MSELGILRVTPASGDEESAKRRQIIEGARAVLLAQGFDAASMNDIARAAGVSKGTLYVYFKHKEQLMSRRSSRGSAWPTSAFCAGRKRLRQSAR
jgi:AcrR family transcriptional regulator